jgi:hypothetical protein
VVLDAAEPHDGQVGEVLLAQRVVQLRDTERDRVELRGEAGARVALSCALDHVLREALVAVGTQRDLAGRNGFDGGCRGRLGGNRSAKSVGQRTRGRDDARQQRKGAPGEREGGDARAGSTR